MPDSDRYQGGANILFISLEFERKGGRICFEAFRQAQSEIGDLTLTVIGESPPPEILAAPGVRYEGLLRKSVPEDLSRFQSLLGGAFLLVHPTTTDCSPHVVIEAGYYGCPSVAPRSFGIPELIEDGVTGFLVNPPLSPELFASRILELYRAPARYRAMRAAARDLSTSLFTWEAVVTKMERVMSSR